MSQSVLMLGKEILFSFFMKIWPLMKVTHNLTNPNPDSPSTLVCDQILGKTNGLVGYSLKLFTVQMAQTSCI